MEPGECWAYRARGVDPLVAVSVVQVGTGKPARVLVEFVDAEYEGAREWVPPSRLKTLWHDLDRFMADEARWAQVRGDVLDDASESAAFVVFETLIDPKLATLVHSGHHGVVELRDLVGLAERFDVDRAVFDHVDAFDHGEVLVAPWEVTERLLRVAVGCDPERILRLVEAEERRAQHEATHGRSWDHGGASHHTDAEWCVDYDLQHDRPVRELLRMWCGAESVARFDELTELRREVKRLGDLTERALDLLEADGSTAASQQLRYELGTPVDMLRRD